MATWVVSWALVAVAGPIVTDEFGGASSIDEADWSYKLDVINVASQVRLISIAPRLYYSPGALGNDALYFVLYEETSSEQWDLVWDSGPQSIGFIPDFHDSPEIDEMLMPGTRYAVGVWFPEGNYTYFYDLSPVLVDHGWAALEGSLWSTEDSTQSLPSSINGPPSGHAYQMRLTVEILDGDGDGVLTEDDCNDADPDVYPGARELCDLRDNDCDGVADPDDPVDHWMWYRDDDGDGHGNPAIDYDLCTGEDPAPGWVELGDDCDDDDPSRYPTAREYCDGLDNDCSGTADDNLAYADGWADSDGDGYGDPEEAVPWCEVTLPAGVADNDLDCDDTDAAAFPGSVEICDGADDDCDALIDEGLATTTIFRDLDGDGHGDPGQPFEWCEVLPPAASAIGDDCDDTSAVRFPGNPEVCDGLDNNCDNVAPDEQDADSDGFLACEDCGDEDATIFPGAPEVCDGLDHDCDGVIPERLDCDPAPDEDLVVKGCDCDAQGGAGSLGLLSGALLLLGLRRRR